MLKYEAHYYDEYLNLKVPLLLWLGLIYAARHGIFWLSYLAIPSEIISYDWITVQLNLPLLFTDAVPLLVLISMGHRLPEGSKFMHKIWTNAKVLMVLTYIFEVLLFAYLNMDLIESKKQSNHILVLSVLLFDFSFLFYFLKSKLIVDLFKETTPKRI